MVKSEFYQWVKVNSNMLANASSLVCTTAMTAGLGFAYWWVAAQQFPPIAIGLASAAISAMMLLGNVGILGLGTLLVGELPRQRGKEASLISAALILVGGVGGCVGVMFALVAPLFSVDLRAFQASIGNIALFAVGVSLTAITIVLDQALIGLLRGGLQFWRNTCFAVSKLVLLFLPSLWLSQKVGMSIYATWVVGNVLSLLFIVGVGALGGNWRRSLSVPDWGLLRKLGKPALQHHLLNLILQAPTMALPLLVTILLSSATGAWFYVSWMIAGFIFVAAYALTTVLYAINTSQPAVLAHKIRLTLSL